MDIVVDTSWLASHMEDPDVIILDASYPALGGQQPRDSGVRIKGARTFEIDHFSDQQSDLPHMVASAEEFEMKAQALGINKHSHLVIYDNLGIYSSPRARWMFNVMGHQKASVLDGGLPKWIEEGRLVEETSKLTFPKGNFEATLISDLVKSMKEVKENIDTRECLLIDARSKGRFYGTVPEPRPHLSSGHIPNSMNIPFQDVLKGGCFRAVEELRLLFDSVPDKPMVFSCGSGLTACIVLLAAEQVCESEKAVYDGSWTEWASYDNNPVVLRNQKI